MKRISNRVRGRLHARLLVDRSKADADYFLSDGDFRFAADCERMRVDRNGSILALLLVRLPEKKSGIKELQFLGRVLEGRLRATDTPGLLEDGRIGILLPDTQREGAWKVAADISEVYPPGPDRPECDVLIYPPQPRHRTSAQGSQVNEQAVAAPVDAADDVAAPSSEAFFARTMPRWKRAIDVIGATVGLIGTAPILVAAMAAVKATSPGPVLFVQEREGRGGRRFRIWKVRTMRHDAEELKATLRSLSEQDGPAFKMSGDPRITRLGRFLRWTSVDEIPQFWNVLRGDMSLVGPRPLPTEESLACKGWQRRRLDVMPGMTCTWQVRGRGRVRFDDWARMDLRYAARTSVWKDLRLVLATLPSLLFQRGMR
jgi:lipopolysaccharide/colanic/teichoic acid biosynthesis glycosyltransferase